MIKFNGKKVPKGKLADVVMDDVKKRITLQLNEKIKGLVCEEHSQSPVVTFDASNSKVNIAGCCQAIIDKARNLLDNKS